MYEPELPYGCRSETAEIVQKLRLIDDIFMTKVFEDKACAQLLLRVILGRDDLTVINVVSQLEVKNLQGRSSRFDIYAVDNEGKNYNVEVQRDDNGADERRARYNASLLDANMLKPRQSVKELPETYVIFITENDVLGGNKPVYTINRTIAEMDNAVFGDGAHIIYVNGEIRDKTELGKLMQDFFCRDPQKMNSRILSERTVHFKQSKEGFDNMCKLVDDYAKKLAEEQAKDLIEQTKKQAEEQAKDLIEQAKKQAEEQAKKQAEQAKKQAEEQAKKQVEQAKKQAEEQAKKQAEQVRAIALELWKKGFKDPDEIAEITKLPPDEVKQMFKGESA